MPLTSAPVLPPELVGLIVQNLSGSRTLQICALISRTWAIPCQRALFHDLHLYEYLQVVRLPAHLIRYPHLQRSIQHVSICHTPSNITTRNCVAKGGPLHKYLSGLVALFPLISRITSLDVTFDRSRRWDTHDQQFVEAFGTFLRQSESLKVLAINGLQDESDLQQMFSFLDGTQIRRLSLHTEYASRLDPISVDFFSPTLTIAHLPSVESFRIDSYDAYELDDGLSLWLRQHPAMFPRLKHLEVVVHDGLSLFLWFRDILKPAALRLESFRLELNRIFYHDMPSYRMPSYENLFDSLRFRHLQLHMFVSPYRDSNLRDAQDIIDWFSAMSRHLVHAGSTIHFTELTFTFADIAGLEWGSVDDVLSHAAFGGVKHIHFEKDSHGFHERTLITNLEHPELVSEIRDAFPRLASRGVLCF
ncbi:hypothetical protein BDZ89DRAFT_1164963 [Hymenopellis radicata]|nr:hypothetical protein BDZ89DRAFT_1164963 [Hymenopellis radicata]